MQLNIPERVQLLGLLPKEGTYADIKTIREAREVIALTSDDLVSIEFNFENERYNLTKAESIVKDIPLNEWTTNTIAGILVKREHDKKLTEDLRTLYEKFIIAHE